MISHTPPGTDANGPGDVEADHGRVRERRMWKGSIAALVARLVSLVAGFATVPILLHHLGEQQFGVWATITSLALLLTFADLGLSNGVVTAIADADAADDRARMQRDVSSVFALLTVLGAAVITLFVLLGQVMDVGDLIGGRGQVPSNEVGLSLLAFVACLAISLPLGIVIRIQMGFQETAAAYSWIAVGSALGLLGTLVVVALDGSLAAVVLATVGGPVVAAALNTLAVFGRSRRWLRPRWRYASWDAARTLMRAGGMWLAIQSAATISYQSDALVISHVLGPDAVTAYTIPMRLFLFMPALMSFALLPMWPAIRSALARRDVHWVRRVSSRMSLLAGVAVVVPTLILLVAAPRIIDVWTGSRLESPRGLLIVLALWAVTSCLVTPIAFLLAGLDALRFQVATNVCMAVLNLGLSIPLAHAVGIEGVALATVIANIACIIIPSLWYIPRVFARLDQPRDERSSV